jgi:hypothetical protein
MKQLMVILVESVDEEEEALIAAAWILVGIKRGTF